MAGEQWANTELTLSWSVSPSAMILFWQSIPMSAKKLPRME